VFLVSDIFVIVIVVNFRISHDIAVTVLRQGRQNYKIIDISSASTFPDTPILLKLVELLKKNKKEDFFPNTLYINVLEIVWSVCGV